MSSLKALIRFKRNNLENLIIEKNGNLQDAAVIEASQSLDLILNEYNAVYK